MDEEGLTVEHLDGPITRVCAPDVPAMPYSKPLTRTREAIEIRLRALSRFGLLRGGAEPSPMAAYSTNPAK